MKRIRKVSYILATIAALGMSYAQAAVQFPFGWYLEGNVGVAKTSNNNYGAGTSATTPGTSFNGNVGYKFMPYFAGELGYTRYANSKIKFGGVTVAKDKHYSVDIAAKGILPIVDTGAELFAKVGAAMVRSDISTSYTYITNAIGLKNGTHTSTGLYIGFGGDYSVTPNIPINLQWARSVGDNKTGNLDLYSIGVAYIFA